jgi:hypothetical protein
MENKKTENKKAQSAAPNLSREKEEGFAIPRENYKYIIVGVVLILLGFILMVGGKSDNPNVFNPDVFSFRRITLAPMIVLAGFVFELWAIMRVPKKDQE